MDLNVMRRNKAYPALKTLIDSKHQNETILYLIEALKDEDEYVRAGTEYALELIDPQAAAKAGVN